MFIVILGNSGGSVLQTTPYSVLSRFRVTTFTLNLFQSDEVPTFFNEC